MEYFVCQPADRPAGDEQKEDTLKITTEAWYCQWAYNGNHRKLYVPPRYLYDGGSVPRIFWTISGLWPDGLARAGYLAHDALYRAAGGNKPEAWSGCVLQCNGVPGIVDRREADWVLREFMRYAGMWRYRASMAYMAVRIGGKSHWGGPMPTIS